MKMNQPCILKLVLSCRKLKLTPTLRQKAIVGYLNGSMVAIMLWRISATKIRTKRSDK